MENEKDFTEQNLHHREEGANCEKNNLDPKPQGTTRIGYSCHTISFSPISMAMYI